MRLVHKLLHQEWSWIFKRGWCLKIGMCEMKTTAPLPESYPKFAHLHFIIKVFATRFFRRGFCFACRGHGERVETPNPIWPPYERSSQRQDMSLKQDLRTRFITKSTSEQLFPLLSIASGYQNSALLDFTDWSASTSKSLVYDARNKMAFHLAGNFFRNFRV